MKPKHDLIRIVRSPKEEISLDTVGKKPGRGAYICNDTTCFNKVIKSKALSRAFKAQIPEDIILELQNQLEIQPENLI